MTVIVRGATEGDVDGTFTKMHGAGNDFVVIDLRAHPFNLSADTYSAIADRHHGIGCDQIILIEPPQTALTYDFDFITRTAAKRVPAATVRAAPHQKSWQKPVSTRFRSKRGRPS